MSVTLFYNDEVDGDIVEHSVEEKYFLYEDFAYVGKWERKVYTSGNIVNFRGDLFIALYTTDRSPAESCSHWGPVATTQIATLLIDVEELRPSERKTELTKTRAIKL